MRILQRGEINLFYAASVLGVHPQTLRRNILYKGHPLTIENIREYVEKRRRQSAHELKAVQAADAGLQRLIEEGF